MKSIHVNLFSSGILLYLVENSMEGVIKEVAPNAVGFKLLGNYHLYENKVHHKTPHDKQYFLSMEFRASWMSAQSFCKSYGMDLMGLGSEHEAKYFMRKCYESGQSFEELSHIGGVLNTYEDHDNWYWIWSNEKVTIDVNLKRDSDKKTEKNCLQLIKGKYGEFSFARTNCFSPELQKFVCQKIVFNKLDDAS